MTICGVLFQWGRERDGKCDQTSQDVRKYRKMSEIVVTSFAVPAPPSPFGFRRSSKKDHAARLGSEGLEEQAQVNKEDSQTQPEGVKGGGKENYKMTKTIVMANRIQKLMRLSTHMMARKDGKATPSLDTDFDQAKVPPYNGNDPRPPLVV